MAGCDDNNYALCNPDAVPTAFSWNMEHVQFCGIKSVGVIETRFCARIMSSAW